MSMGQHDTVNLADAMGFPPEVWLRISLPGGRVLRHDDGADEWVETGWRINPVTSELEFLRDGVHEPRGLIHDEATGTLRSLGSAPVWSGTLPPVANQVVTAWVPPRSPGGVSGLWRRTQGRDSLGARKWFRRPTTISLLGAWALLVFSAATLWSTSPGDSLFSLGKWMVWLLVIPIVILIWRRSGVHAAALVVVAFSLGRGFHVRSIFHPPVESHVTPASAPAPGLVQITSPQVAPATTLPVPSAETLPPLLPPSTPRQPHPPERPPFSRSADGKYTVEVFGDVQQGQLLLVKEGGEHLFELPSIGRLLDVHWSPTGRFLAVNERRGNSGDYLWILDLHRQVVLKKPGDGLWMQMESYSIALLEREARRLWGPEVQGNKSWGAAVQWDAGGNLIAKVIVQCFGQAIPASSSGTLEARVKLGVGDHGASLQGDGATIHESIGSAWLKEGYKISHEKTAGMLTVTFYEPARFGVVRSSARLADVDLDRIKLVPAQDRDAEGSILIELPLHAGRFASTEYWNPSGDNFSWSTPPARVRADESGLQVVARGANEARQWVALLMDLAGRPATVTPIQAPTTPAPLPSPAAVANPFPGERYPVTRQRLLTPVDVGQWTSGQIRYAINEMFARHGATFAKEELKRVFAGFSWYRPDPAATFDLIERERFSGIERANLKELARARDAAAK